MTGLTLPGDIPGLLRRGTPVSCPNDIGLPFDGWSVAGFVGDIAIIASPEVLEAHQAMREALTLDLTDATGRAHATWWLAASTTSLLTPTSATWGRSAYGRIGLQPRRYWPWSHVALASLNPNDIRLLPDGSRWVDAEALRLVCLHVSGRGP